MKKFLLFALLVLAFTSISNAQLAVRRPMFPAGGSSCPSGLVSSYHLEGSTGGTETDSGGSGNTLSDNNTVTSVAGKLSNAKDFESSSGQYVTTGSASGLNNANVSVSVWINVESFNAFGGIASYFPNAWYLETWSDSTVKFFIEDNISVTSGTLSTATWYHIVATFDGATDAMALYVNGSSVATNTSTDTMTFSTPDLRIGGVKFLGEYDGLVDEVQIYNVALTSGSVTTLYNSGSGLSCP